MVKARIGTIDELEAHIGFVRQELEPKMLDKSKRIKLRTNINPLLLITTSSIGTCDCEYRQTTPVEKMTSAIVEAWVNKA